jgi:translation initiation factor 2 alpha subunit (eIF-2alpha)
VIKQALQAGLAAGVADDVSIQLVRSPTFMIWTTTIDETKGVAALENVINTIQEEITKLGGNFAVRKEPAVITKVE